ncbi:hypothetical protein GWI72_12735 [Microvirga tunisiensis]|uniref:Uncharacterized protein n=2 Tax=Pannonibacter tanglangensis TaxID=2750084 RepID=A0ABW9ZIA9_9HYPH|nr:hypothetical protein [Pannonibacter sp. XCT-34]NBN64602.1 hypothetical protein [Pannonibacter sp. XCT-34]NBN79137.1 hypothetical protein [Pannonibacter sp. XCT-53]
MTAALGDTGHDKRAKRTMAAPVPTGLRVICRSGVRRFRSRRPMISPGSPVKLAATFLHQGRMT